MPKEQVERQLCIINTLCNQQRTTAAALAKEHRVSIKTIRRDLDTLSRIFPVVDFREGKRKYWSLISGFKNIPPLICTPLELYVLREGTRFFKELGDPFLRPALESIVRKIRAGFDPGRREAFENLRRILAVGVGFAKDYSDKGDFLRQLFSAAAAQRRVEIAYQGLKDTKPRIRKVDPYKLWYQEGTVYLIGLCHLRGEIRMFAVDRISLLNLTDEGFLIPGDFKFGEYIRHAFSVMIEDPVHVKVRFDPEIARYITEREWHPSQKIRKNRDKSVVLELTVGGTLEIKRWILSFGPQAEVLEPDTLVEEIRNDLDKMRERYTQSEEQKSRGAG